MVGVYAQMARNILDNVTVKLIYRLEVNFNIVDK